MMPVHPLTLGVPAEMNDPQEQQSDRTESREKGDARQHEKFVKPVSDLVFSVSTILGSASGAVLGVVYFASSVNDHSVAVLGVLGAVVVGFVAALAAGLVTTAGFATCSKSGSSTPTE